MKRLYPLIGLFFLISACASVQSYSKPGINFSNFKKIAIVRFDCPNSGAGQEVADTIGLEFIKHGFNVIERSQLRAVINEEVLVQSGLVEQTRDALKVSGIDSIVVGSVGVYECRPDKVIAFLFGAPIVMNTNNCQASVSMKMLDVQTGDILWAANGSHSVNAVNTTANKVLKMVIDTLSEQIPSPSAPPALKTAPPVEVAKKVVPPEPSKNVVPEAARPAPPVPSALRPTPPVEVAKVVPEEPSKATGPPPPSGLPSEREVRQFFESYVKRYDLKDLEGTISSFSAKAIQNQRDDLGRIRKSYETFFEQMETIQYRITIDKIEPQQNSIEVRGQYQLEGLVLIGRKKINWNGQIRWVLVRENGDLKILSLDYQPESSK